jgi:RHS repeat-associated protein
MSMGIVAESDLVGNLKSEYVFFDGERVARRDFPGNAVSYYFSDHLKTASVITDSAGNIKSESDYYPWGGELQFTSNDSNHYKFTSKERDPETGLDYFGARYYSNGLGRWISADWSATPVPVPYADLTDPQTLNLYGFVRGLPTTKADLDGHGFWRKLWNSARGAECWCEGEEAEKSIAVHEEKLKQIDRELRTPHSKGRQDLIDLVTVTTLHNVIDIAAGANPPTLPSSSGEEETVVVTISRSKSPASAQHIDDAQAAGKPSVVTLDRKGAQGAARAAARGRAATRGLSTNSRTDNDEYPPKCCAQGGANASTRAIPKSDNRSGGGQMGQQTKTLPDGTKIRIKTGP